MKMNRDIALIFLFLVAFTSARFFPKPLPGRSPIGFAKASIISNLRAAKSGGGSKEGKTGNPNSKQGKGSTEGSCGTTGNEPDQHKHASSSFDQGQCDMNEDHNDDRNGNPRNGNDDQQCNNDDNNRAHDDDNRHNNNNDNNNNNNNNNNHDDRNPHYGNCPSAMI
jgi:hypothetical protein